MDVPMLNGEEFKKAAKLYSECMKDLQSHPNMAQRFKPLLDFYNELSSWDETNASAVMHHSIDQYGPACEKCGKPYRTNQASFCAACGNKRN